MTSMMAEIAGCGITWVCSDTLHQKKNNRLFLHNGNVFCCFCSGNHIHQSMHHFQDHFWPDLIIPFISYYSHKSSYFGQHFVKNNEMINVRVY